MASKRHRAQPVALALGLALAGQLMLGAPAFGQTLAPPTTLTDPGFGFFEAYGLSASGSGDTFAVGASGAFPDPLVDVYVREGSTWVRQARLITPDGSANDFFGDAVAQEGERLVVGAPDRLSASGSAYVFVRTNAAWNLEAVLRASDPTGNARFGDAVALDGDTIAIGAIGLNQSRGAVYVFSRATGTWVQQQRLSLADGLANDRLGLSVALSGNVLVAGAPGRDGAALDQGAVVVWRRSGSNWNQEAILRRSTPVQGDRLGASVDVHQDWIIAGAPEAEATGPSGAGIVAVWRRLEGAWQGSAELEGTGNSEGAQFGSAVALEWPRLLVGAPSDDANGDNLRGSAQLFLADQDQWLARERIVLEQGATEDQFGFAVALASNFAGITAPGTVIDGQVLAGAAYAFNSLATTVSFSALPQTPVLIGNTFSLNVAVGAAEGIAPGDVLIRDDQGNSCNAVLTAGAASCSLTATAVGPRSLRARYNGAPGFAESFGSGSVQVKPDLRLQPTSLPEGQIGAPYSELFDAAATGATLPLVYSLAGGSLPPGLSLGGNGVLSGTPTSFGSFNFSVSVSDSSSAALGGPFSETRAYGLLIQPPFRTSLSLDPVASPRDRGVTVNFSALLDVIEAGAGAPSGTYSVSAVNGATSLSCASPVSAEGAQACAIEFGAEAAVGDYAITASFVSTNADYGNSSDSESLRLLSAAEPNLEITALNPLYLPEDTLSFRVSVQNTGPDVAYALRVQADPPAGLQNLAWTCVGSACPAAAGSGAPDLVLNALPAGGSLQIELSGNVGALPPAQVEASASLSLDPAGFSRDLDPGNNSGLARSLPERMFADGFEPPEE